MSGLGPAARLDGPDLRRMGAERLGRLRDQMQAQGVDGAVLLHGPHVTYATGHVPEAVDASHANHRRAVAIVSAANGPARLHAHDPVGDVSAACAEAGAPLWPELDDGAVAVGAAIAEVLGDVTGCRVAVDAVTGAMARAGVLDGAELVDASRVLGPARVVKTADELACIDEAQRHTERAMDAAQAACVPGATRAEVVGTFLAALRDGDATSGVAGTGLAALRDGDATSAAAGAGLAVPCAMATSPAPPLAPVWPIATGSTRSSSPCRLAATAGPAPPRAMWPSPPGSTTMSSPRATSCGLTPGSATWVTCPTSGGPGWRGSDPTPAEQSLCDRWMAVLHASLAAVRPGATLGDVGRAARAVEPEETPWLPHFYLAHGLGLESAEMPMVGTDLGPAFDDGYELAAGMVLVFEPVIWADGVGGYRAEEIVAVTDNGWRLLGGGHHYEPFRS